MLVSKPRVDDLEYGPHTTQGMQAMHSLQCTVRENLDSMVAALDRPTPPCAACGAQAAFGQHQYAMRIVPPVGEHGSFAVDIELTRRCVRCGDTNADEVSMIVGSSADSAQRGLDAFRDGVVMISRARARLRSTLAEADGDNALPRLQAALGMYLDAHESTNEFVKVVDMHAVAAVAQRLTTLSSGATARIVHRVCAVLERTRVVARQHEQVAGARDILELELPTAASELRECAACGATKAYEAFSDNQWRKARPKRRCIECQSNGVPRDDRVRDGARADTAALAFEALALNERRRVDQELARRNAEHNDNDCPICFGETAEAERVVLHDGAAHWVCVSCRVDLREHGLTQCPSCRAPCDAYKHSD